MKLIPQSVFLFHLLVLSSYALPIEQEYTFKDCTSKQAVLCQDFLQNGGLDCHRNSQIICYHENQEMNDRDYCTFNATYSCRTFRTIYGYYCNATDCIQSNKVI
ncbi:uncharacterized protein BX663DRAFT_503534 [Cokeromyces recurvatus]|uniref:uncharacterized protein n=1 Tax=Cokeromyces recurvatus TaxID=90255 RepID=UPI00221FC22F|nr:uncharacterized protein BX663DRAFT_503534 [Cokeromyces recurvatus]KAI7904786.1 hypothetical protein BX663DRAFT_503534 [Cokeromyces recurvatus]